MSSFILSEANSTENSRKSTNKKKNNDNPDKAFKLESQQLLLTYSQCPINPDEMLEFIKTVVEEWGLDTYIVAQENHKDEGLHLHCYLKLKKKPHKNNAQRIFDYKEYHPKIEGCRSWKNVVKYVTKDGKYITNISEEELKKILLANTKVGEIYEKAYQKAREEGVEAGMKELETVKTYRDLVVHGETIEKNLRKLRGVDNNVRYKLEQFKPLTFEWNRRKTLILTGPSDTGKTSLALAILPKSLFVSDIDDLREYNSGKYEGIVMDDMSFLPDPITGRGGLSRDQQIALFDCDHPRHIRSRYQNARIPAMTPKIITSNLNIEDICLSNDDAIKKRIQHVKIVERCYRDEEDEIVGVSSSPLTTTTTTTTTAVVPPSPPTSSEDSILSSDFRWRFEERTRKRAFREWEESLGEI